MPISDATPPVEGLALQLQTDDIVQALRRRNPGAARAALEQVGRIVALVSKVVLSDEEVARRVAGLSDAGTLDVVCEIASGLHGRPRDAARTVDREAPERMRGAGFGEIVDRRTGSARLADHASATRLEEWAGPVAGADEILVSAGVTSEALEVWTRSRAIVELSDGHGRVVYPSRQFSGGCPIPGLAEVQAVIGDAPTAWLWLVEPNDDGAPCWLDILRQGDSAEVLEAARQDFR